MIELELYIKDECINLEWYIEDDCINLEWCIEDDCINLEWYIQDKCINLERLHSRILLLSCKILVSLLFKNLASTYTRFLVSYHS